MSAPAESAGQTLEIMKPYTRDHQARGHRRWRSLVVVLMGAFCFIYGMAWALFAPYLIVLMAMPPALLSLVVIWALPDTKTAPTRALVAFFFAFFVGMVMWPNYLALALPGLPWITVARLTGFPMAFMLLLCTAMSEEFRSRVATSLSATPWILRFLLTFLVIQTVLIAASRSPFFSLDRYFIFQTNFTAIFFAACYVFVVPGRVTRMASLLWIMAISLGVIGIIEQREQHVPWVGHIPSFLQIEGERIQAILMGARRAGDGIYRVQATYSPSLGLAEYLALCMPFVMHFGFTTKSPWVRLAAIASVPFMLYIVLITGSRLGMVGCLASFLLYTLIWSLLRWRQSKESLLEPAIALGYPAVFTVVMAATLFIGRIRTVVWGNGAATSSNMGRQIQMNMGLPKIWHHPWGYGPGTGASTLGYFDIGGLLTIDSYFLNVALEYGVVGFIVYYGIFAIAVAYGAYLVLKFVRLTRELTFIIPAIISIANFIIIKSVFSQEDNHPVVFMILGMIVVLCWRIRQEHPETGQAQSVA